MRRRNNLFCGESEGGELCQLDCFVKYVFCQLKWTVINQPAMHDDYAGGKINEELDEVLAEAEKTFKEFSKDYTAVFR